MSVNQAIKNLRTDMGLSQLEFADKCGVTLERVQQLEHESGHYKMNSHERDIIQRLHVEHTPDTHRPELINPRIVAMHNYEPPEMPPPSERKLSERNLKVYSHRTPREVKPVAVKKLKSSTVAAKKLKQSTVAAKPIDPKQQELKDKINFLESKGFSRSELAVELYDFIHPDSNKKGGYVRPPVSYWFMGRITPNKQELAGIDQMCARFGYKPQKDKGKES